MARRKIEVIISGDTSSLERAFGRAGTSAKGFGRSLGSVSVGAAAAIGGLVLAADKLRDGFLVSRDAASNLEESTNKVSVVFGNAAKAVKDFSKTSADALGLSQAAALEAAGSFGQLFSTSGINERQAAKFSTTLVGLAGDIASFNNLDPGDALEKLRAGLAGEAEPLRTVGVLLSEARVQQEAYASGIARAGAKLTEAQKVTARYQIILRDTAKTQGDFARTSDGYANATRRVRAQLENIAASVGGVFLPALAKGASAVAGFLNRLREADGFRARFNVVFDGVKDIASGLVASVRGAVDRINWDQVLATARREIPKAATRALELLVGAFRTLGSTLGRVLGSVDWGGVGRFIGQRIVQALRAVSSLLQSVDWQRVGGALVTGFRRFLAAVPWKQIVVGAFKVAVAALKAVGSLLLGAGRELGKAILDGLKAGLANAGEFLKQKALQIVLVMVEPFSKLPTFLGGWARDAKVRVNVELDAMGVKAEQTADRIRKAFTPAARKERADGPVPEAGNILKLGEASIRGIKAIGRQAELERKKAADSVRAAAAATTAPVAAPAVSLQVGRSAAEQASRVNQFFDNKISRALDRVQDLPKLKQQLGRLKEIAATITARIQVTKDLTRKLQLEDTLVDVIRRISSTRGEIGSGLLDSLQFGVDSAQATRQLSDDLAAYRALQSGLQQRIREEGRTLELTRQVLQVRGQIQETQQQIRQRQAAARQADQFRQLGLTAAGAQRIPGVDALRKQLGRLDTAVSGSFLDTTKTRGLLQRVRSVLAGGLGRVGDDVRQKIREILDGVDQELRNRSNQPLTAFRKANVTKILEQEGLTPELVKAVRGRLSQVDRFGRIPTPRAGAFGQITGSDTRPIVVNTRVTLDHREVGRSVTKVQQTTARRNPAQKRGILNPRMA